LNKTRYCATLRSEIIVYKFVVVFLNRFIQGLSLDNTWTTIYPRAFLGQQFIQELSLGNTWTTIYGEYLYNKI